MQFPPPVSPEDLLSLINRNPALTPPISSRSSTSNIPISRAPVEIRLEQEVEEVVDYDAGAMIVRRFSWYALSYIDHLSLHLALAKGEQPILRLNILASAAFSAAARPVGALFSTRCR